MKTIRLTHPHQLKSEECPKTVVALGYFDGVHKGHQEVINTAKNIALKNGYQSAVMTFTPHPSVVLRKTEESVQNITPVEKKQEIFSQMGIDRLYLVTFDQALANLLPQEFIDEFIIGLNIKHVVAGFDYTYGKMGKGTMETLPFHSRKMFTQTTVDKIASGEKKISSTLIRQCINEGKVSILPEYLGRFYEVEGIVSHGEKRGRTIGFPTANIALNDDYMCPVVGVYAVKMKVNDKWHAGVCNIGYKPTFHDENPEKPTVEVHLFDFDEQIYGEGVIVQWHKRIRSEKKFGSIDELKAQIQKDKDQAIQYFKNL